MSAFWIGFLVGSGVCLSIGFFVGAAWCGSFVGDQKDARPPRDLHMVKR